LLTVIAALEPREIPKFVIDFDLPPELRYDQVYHHFKDTIIKMENYFFYVLSPEMRSFYAD
jgi:hypothetical protein